MRTVRFKRATWNRLLQIGVLIFSCVSDLGAATSVASCDDETEKPFARIDYGNYGACVKRREDDMKGGALVLTEKSEFATRCPVPVISMEIHPSTKCAPVANALKYGDALRVDEWPGGIFALSLLRGGQMLFPSQPLLPLEIELSGSKRTLGYYADVRLPPDFSHPGQATDVRYYIYLSNVVQAMKEGESPKPIRYYSVEVFEPSQACRAEQPAAGYSEIVNCADIEFEIETVGAGQYPSGGGGEPPPKPK